MDNTKTLFENEDIIDTEMGAWFAGERVVFRGKDLLNELNEKSWMSLLIYGITGKQFSEKQTKMFESIWVISASFPDPRLWNNRVATFAGTTRSTGALGISAAIATSDAELYGNRPLIASISFIRDIQSRLEDGEELSDLILAEHQNNRIIYGFGRPIVKIDERINPLMRRAKQLGFAEGKYVQLAFRIEQELKKHRPKVNMNIAFLIAAFSADFGLSDREHYHYMTLCFTAGMFPCMIDAENKTEGSFLPLRCDRIDYRGPGIRKWIEEPAND